MYAFRDRENKANVAKRQQQPVIEIAATHDHLPLLQDNWAERWSTLPKEFEQIFERLQNFEVRYDDVYVEGFMKSGTTWMHETVWQLMNQLDFNYKTLKKDELRRHFLEFNGIFANCEDRISKFDKLPGPRLFQTHLPVNLLPKQYWQKKPKTIYVARNVKDVVVSAYHFLQCVGVWRCGTIDEFVQDFMNNDIINTPFWAHIVDFWQLRHEPHIYFVTYEEMKRDLADVIRNLCVFLEKPALTEKELTELVKHLSFEQMKSNEKANPTSSIKTGAPEKVDSKLEFMRRGIVGSYKDELSAENQNRLNEWSRNCLARHGIREEDIFGSL